MNILLVEDEIKVRKHIKDMLIDLGYDHILEADNGVDAMNVISTQKIDIILSDIEMPAMNGLALLSEVGQTLSKDAVFIILSAYDSFDYARKAIEKGVLSYMLKPIKTSDLESIMTLAVSKIKQQKEQQKNANQMINTYNQSLQLQRRHLLTGLITKGVTEDSSLQKSLSELSIEFPSANFLVILIKIIAYNTSVTSMSNQDEQLFRFSISNIFTEIISEMHLTPFVFDYPNGEGFLLNLESGAPFSRNHPLYHRLIEVKQTIESLLNITVSLAASKRVDSTLDLHDAFLLADQAMAQRLIDKSDLYFIDSELTQHSFSYVIDFADEQRLLSCFEKNSVKDATVFINELFIQIMSIDLMDSKKLNNYFYQMIILLFKITKQFNLNPEATMGDEYILYTEVIALGSIPEMNRWFLQLITNCFEALDALFEKGNTSGIYRAKHYIDTNYGADLSLESVAEYIYMSPEHFSRLFKKTFDCNFSHYLASVRMSASKELLLSSSMKINEIALKVGYHDTKYFSKLFKTHVGMTPSEYRKTY